MKTEVNGTKFLLHLNTVDKPYVLKRWQWNEARSRQYWATVWADWHKGLPTGIRAKAIELMGFRWNQQAQQWDTVRQSDTCIR